MYTKQEIIIKCYRQGKSQRQIARQLALAVILYSPLQMAADMIENYEANPAPFEFVKACPVNWERTLVPHAQIGAYLTTVRKDRDSSDAHYQSHPYSINIEEQEVTAQSTLTMQLAPEGGTAIELVKN